MYIPEKYYVGFQSQGEDSLVGFFTPDDGDDKSKKRKQTVDNWSSAKLKSNATTITNEPRTGFRIVDTARRYRTQNVLFRIIHPEVGAEFEITAENLNDLHQQCIIEYGEIKTELFFVRNGTNNILVVKDSVEHKNALQHMKDAKAKQASMAKIDKKDITEGIKLKIASMYHNVTYLGRHSISCLTRTTERTVNESNAFKIQTLEDKYYIFSSGSELQLRKSWPKIEQVFPEKNEKSTEEILSKITRVITNAVSYESIQVYDVAFDTVLDKNDYEMTFEVHSNHTMNNISDWRNHSGTYAVFADGSYASLYPRWTTINGNRVLALEYDYTYTVQGLEISTNRNPRNATNWGMGCTLYITDPTTTLYAMKIIKKVKE